MKILIIKTSALGDIIHAFPTLQYLRQRYPQAQIDWVVERPFADLVNAHPAVNHVYTIQVKKWRKNLLKKETWSEIKQLCQQLRTQHYDMVLDLQGNVKSGIVTGLSKGLTKIGFGYRSVPEWPNLLFTRQRYNPPPYQNIRNDYLFLAQSFCGDFTDETEGVQLTVSSEGALQVQQILKHPALQNRLMIMICPGSNWTNKQLSPNGLKSFLNRIYSEFSVSFLFIWGTEEEKKLGETLAQTFQPNSLVIDRLLLPVLQNLMSHMHAVIAMDSLPLHLAGTTSVPTYSVFGASSSRKYKPIGIRNQAFQGACPFNKKFEKRCSILRSCESGACIKTIDNQALFEHFFDWWQTIYGLSK